MTAFDYGEFTTRNLGFITEAEQAALRAGGCLDVHEVARATIETNGQITVVLRRR